MARHTLLVLLLALPASADDATDALARELRDYASAELAKVPGKDGKYSTALPDLLGDLLEACNRNDRDVWSKINTKADWEKFRDERVAALRASLGTFPEVPKSVPVRVTRTIEAGDYAIDNLLYESRPGVWVTGNLYRPATKRDRMPVILIAHSHHAPKEQGELQDMGVTWAKLGCLVLVIDQLGHGERRQHPFVTAKDYPKEFRVGRQDYYFRYNLNLQLSLVGDSLMGWMAWDLMRGLDVALARPGADKERVILLGAVAAGGDVAAVTAALDPRVTCVVPFNFGGPQPETRYPLPENADEWFNYAGSGSWESTRNLRDSAAGGFLPWAIVASVAPRRVIHAHEFSWDRDRDPVWKRYQKVWGFYNATENLSFTTGTGQIQVNDAKASHCTNIGPIQRKCIYAALKKWFDIPVPEKEVQERRPASELRCWTEAAMKELTPKPLHEVLAGMADEQRTAGNRTLAPINLKDRPMKAVERIGKPLHIDFEGDRVGLVVNETGDVLGTHCRARWIWPFKLWPNLGLLISPVAKAKTGPRPVVLCISHEGPGRFLKETADAIAAFVRADVCVLIVQLTGTGRDLPRGGRGRASSAASLSATAWMVQRPILAIHWHAVRLAIALLEELENEVDTTRMAVWGDSFALPNRPDAVVGVPHDLTQPPLAEPAAAFLATVTALERYGVKAVVARGGLVSYRSILDSPFVHIPHDALPVNIFRAGDLPDVWAHLAPKPLRLEGLVDGTNRRVIGEKLKAALRPVADAYKKGEFVVKEDYTPDVELAKWIIDQLKK